MFAYSYAQESRVISLQECMEQAVINHPLYKQHQLQADLKNLKMDNIKADLLPQLSVNGKATLQNEVIELPISLPGVSIPSMSKDQYRLSLDVNQALYRGGLNKYQNRLEQDNLLLADLTTDKELYGVKAQAKDLFFQIVLLEKQSQIVSSYKLVLESKLEEAEVNSRKIIDGYHFLVSIAPETIAANLDVYTETITNSGIADYVHKGLLLEITFLDGTTYEYFGVTKAIYIKMINSNKLNRYAKRAIYPNFIYRKSKRTLQEA